MMLSRTVTRGERGMCTAEYAVGTVAACGFACLLFEMAPTWRTMLTGLLIKAFELRVGWPFSGFPW